MRKKDEEGYPASKEPNFCYGSVYEHYAIGKDAQDCASLPIAQQKTQALYIGGLIWGLNFHQVSYVADNQGVYTVLTYDGFYTFRQENTGNLYIIQDLNFRLNPAGAFDGSTTYTVPTDFSFIASTDTVFVGWGVGLAHPIEKVTFDDATYISTEYQAYPHGYTLNNWPHASPLMLTGMLCIGFSVSFCLVNLDRLSSQ
jgi:hypothetical protein